MSLDAACDAWLRALTRDLAALKAERAALLDVARLADKFIRTPTPDKFPVTLEIAVALDHPLVQAALKGET